MAIIAKAASDNFVLCPAGTHAAVCVDIVDLGIVESEFQGKKKKLHKVRIVWQIDEANEETKKPYTAGKRYTLSLHEKANLRKDLESWRGKPFTAQECEGFDLEALLSVGALINVIHETKGDKTYDNVTSIMRVPKAMQAPTPQGYIRVCDRDKKPDQTAPDGYYDDQPITDDDVPF